MKYLLLLLIPLLFLQGGCVSDAARTKASYHYQMGLSFLGESNITRALVEFTEAEKITPNDPLLLNYLGLTYFYKKKFELAEKKYLRAIKLKPNYSEARNHLGVNYLEMSRWDEAIAQFKVVSEDLFFADPQFALINMGLAYYGKGEYDTALSVLQGVVNDYPRIPQARVSLGRVYAAMEKPRLAIAEFKAAIELNKEYADAYYNLGITYGKLNDKRAAAAAFREVIRIARDSDRGLSAREFLENLEHSGEMVQ